MVPTLRRTEPLTDPDKTTKPLPSGGPEGDWLRMVRALAELYLWGLLFCLPAACRLGDEAPGTRFERLPLAQTGISFENTLPENDSINIVLVEYLYNGGGVGVGDFDRNGLPDLVFTGNQVASEVYLQREPWVFTKVELPGTAGTWAAGVSVHDVNSDGLEDIYLSTLNIHGTFDTPNLLFINRGLGTDSLVTFEEQAALYGLADPGYCTQSAWLDVDLDGDLDLYVLRNSLETQPRNAPRGPNNTGNAPSVDRLYVNEGPGVSPQFRLDTVLNTEGWGLGVAVTDINDDRYPDLYSANDFLSNDELLINDGHGGFSDSLLAYTPHTSFNSMGIDIADLSGDAAPEIMVVDMLPDDNLRRKTMFGDIPYAMEAARRERGYVPQYARNTLLLRDGNGFSDVSFLTGTAATDWSWSTLLADLDNDGLRDIFVTNGYPKDITDKDFTDFASESTIMGSAESQVKTLIERLKNTEGVHQANFFFRNRGELSFENVSEAWVGSEPDYSNGAVYVDLDLDGDLDLVTNNINGPAGVFRNRTRELSPDSTHYLRIRLRGTSANPDALGTKVYVKSGETTAFGEQYKVRGYLSSVDAVLHFGLGGRALIDSILVAWPDGHQTRLGGVAADQVLELDIAEAVSASGRVHPSWLTGEAALWTVDPLDPARTTPRHVESDYSDFSHQALAQRDLSRNGPALASIDLGGADREALVIGGAAGSTTQVWAYAGAGGWRLAQDLPSTVAQEATCLCVFDADGDGDLDLYQGNGSTEAKGRPQLLRDQLFLNLGGQLVEVSERLPDIARYSGSCAAADIDGDGWMDLAIGVRLDVERFPMPAPSYWLKGGRGRMTVGAELSLGNVTDVVLGDFDGEGTIDLAYVGEYVAPTVQYSLSAKPLAGIREVLGPTGWWYSLTAADLDQDGDLDLLAGNLGLNTNLQASATQPLTLIVDDFDKNGALDPILTAFLQGESYPVHPRNSLGRQLPKLKQQMPSYAAYAAWTIKRLPPPGPDGQTLRAEGLASMFFHNEGPRRWKGVELPRTGQMAPVRDAILVSPLGEVPYLLVVENDYAVQVLDGPLDAGNGFALSLGDSGLLMVDRAVWNVRGDGRSVVRIGDAIAVGLNNGPVLTFLKTVDKPVR